MTLSPFVGECCTEWELLLQLVLLYIDVIFETKIMIVVHEISIRGFRSVSGGIVVDFGDV